jgi:hypothetical protein
VLSENDFLTLIKGKNITKNRTSFKYEHTSVQTQTIKIHIDPKLNNREAIYINNYFTETKPFKLSLIKSNKKSNKKYSIVNENTPKIEKESRSDHCIVQNKSLALVLYNYSNKH